MEDYIRHGLLIVAALILLFVIVYANRKKPEDAFKLDDETLPIFNDKDELQYDFLLKTERDVEPERMSFELKENQHAYLLSPENKHVPEKSFSQHPNLLTLAVMARAGCYFASYDLLQAISSAGLQYGDMNIFHFYEQTEDGNLPLFSLASANEPGEFDLNHIGDFSCSGLVLFMKTLRVTDPKAAFQKMLSVAQQLAEVLDGELKADPRTPWTVEMSRKYQEKLNSIELV